MDFTAEQERAVYTGGCELLVSAAAGSGKTAVLVERIIHLITEKPANIEEPVNIDRLLVVTFTEAAANEMRQRISAELYERQQRAPDDENLQKQMLLLPRSQISTIHKFCAHVVRRYFHLTDIDPNFKIADETEVRLLKGQVLDELFEEHYAGDAEFFRLVDYYGGGRTKDAGLHELVLEISGFISGFPWPEKWLEQAAEMYNISELEEAPWAAVLREELLRRLDGIAATVEYAMGLAAEGAEKYIEALQGDMYIVEGLRRRLGGGFEDFREGLYSAEHAQLKRYSPKDEFDPGIQKRVQDIRNKEIKPAIKELRRIFMKPIADAKRDITELYPVQAALCGLVREFMSRYGEAKRRRNIADFNDLEQYALRVLLNPDSGEPSEAAIELRERFFEVMIDEYQDSNLVQELILSAVADGNRFMVGDIKQSIYKFRGARPEIFMGKYKEFRGRESFRGAAPCGLPGGQTGATRHFRPPGESAGPASFLERKEAKELYLWGSAPNPGDDALKSRSDFRRGQGVSDPLQGFGDGVPGGGLGAAPPRSSSPGIRIDLSKNFRSRECVIDAVNMFFYQLMTAEGGVEYDESSALYYGADYPSANGLNISQETELYLIDGCADEDEDTDLSRVEMEAIVVAERINALVRGETPLYVLDKGVYRRAGFRDIVIILRSVRGVAETFLEVLKKNGIPAFADVSTGYFESVEVMTMLSFLQVTDNPKQDIPLLAVLRCPVYGLTDEQLLDIRGVRQNAMFYDCVAEYAQSGEDTAIIQKLERFLADLEKFRREAVYLPISALINSVYTSTDYFNYVGAMPGGAVRQANLRLLQEKAVQYEETSYTGLFHFIGYMQKVKNQSDEGDAKALSENADLVRLMTIHKSKGLEFPVVFVSLLGRGFSRADEKKPVIMHETLGLGTPHIDLERRVRSNTLPRIAITKKQRQESLAEELRVLYVAMTRAKEKLILTGGVPDLGKAVEKWSRYAGRPEVSLPAHAIYDANNYLDWIAPALYHENRPKAAVAVYYKTLSDILEVCIDEEEREEERHNALDVLEYDHAVESALLWEYPLKAVAGLPAKLSISEIKRLHSRGVDSDAVAYAPQPPVYTKPRFLREGSEITPAGKGTVMHTVLEHMDMSRVNGVADIRALVSRLVAGDVLSPHEAEAVDCEALYKFNQSGVMRRIIAAQPGVYRETPFVMGLTPYQIYKNPEFKGSDATVLVHGIIDCYFEENGGIVLVDYKTDYVKSIETILENYSLQMSVYKLALERATGKEVRECLLYLFGLGREVEARVTEL